MEVGVGVLREAGQEKLKECPYILCSSWGIGGGRAVRRVTKSNVDWLIQEDDVGMLSPAIRVILSEGSRDKGRGYVLCDRAWPEFKEESSRGRATWATV